MSEYDNNKTNYEPNFILKPAAAPQADEMEVGKTAEIDPEATIDQAAAAPKAGPAEIPKAPEVNQEAKPDSPATEVLRAAAAKAEALKAAAAKIDPAMEPYRRQTSEIGDPIFRDMPADNNTVTGGTGSVTGSAERTATGANADHPAAAQKSDAGTGFSGTASPSRSAGNNFGRTTASNGSASSSFGRTAAPSGNAESSFSSADRNYGGAAAGTAGAAGAAGNASRFGGRPAFENPSFDPGRTGSYEDPRMHFRASGESASWSNGEVHRSRKQMRDSIHKQAKQKKGSRPVTLTRRGLALLVAGCMFLSCLFGFGGSVLGNTLLHSDPVASVPTTPTSVSSTDDSTVTPSDYSLEDATGSDMTIKEITSMNRDSVVEIRTESVSSDSWMQQYVTEGAGSGVIISKDGYIMTNNHVIENANKIKVTTADQKEYEATLVGTDESNDVAVIKIDAKGLNPATYGNSDQLEVGDMAVAIGNPLGELGGTVTAGIISATDRELSIDGKTLHLLQTDSSINPGNSGGGLFNGSGQLIGLVVAKSAGSDVEGLGFAIPINTAADVAQQLIDKGYVSGQPSTGMTYQEGTPSTGNGSDAFSSFDSFFGNSTTGLYIYSVNGKNAKKAGFQPGDQVYAVDGEEITSFNALSAIITAHKVGDELTFTIIRDGVQKNIKLKLEEKTATSQNSGQTDDNGQNQQNPVDPGNNQGTQPPGSDQGNNAGGWQEWFGNFF